MLGQRRRCWTNIRPALVQCLVFAEISVAVIYTLYKKNFGVIFSVDTFLFYFIFSKDTCIYAM